MTTFPGDMVFGVRDPLPLKGFPAGRARIRMRNRSCPQVFIRPPEGGVWAFYVYERDGCWWPRCEVGANRVTSNCHDKHDRQAAPEGVMP